MIKYRANQKPTKTASVRFDGGYATRASGQDHLVPGVMGKRINCLAGGKIANVCFVHLVSFDKGPLCANANSARFAWRMILK